MDSQNVDKHNNELKASVSFVNKQFKLRTALCKTRAVHETLAMRPRSIGGDPTRQDPPCSLLWPIFYSATEYVLQCPS